MATFLIYRRASVEVLEVTKDQRPDSDTIKACPNSRAIACTVHLHLAAKQMRPVRGSLQVSNVSHGIILDMRVGVAEPQAGRLSVRLTMPSWTVYRSTDRTYVTRHLVRLAETYPLDFLQNRSARTLLDVNARYLAQRAGLTWLANLGRGSPGAVAVPSDTAADVVFSYGSFPRSQMSRPVIWEQTFGPASRHIPREVQVETIRRGHEWCVDRAAAIITATEESVAYFREAFPRAAAKIRCVPYYLPHVDPVRIDYMDAKFAKTDPLRMLFVGKQAKRKGLEALLAAFVGLPPVVRRRIRFTVVTPMLDGRVTIPSDVQHFPSVPDAIALMRDSHLFAFPTTFEAFGLVLVEAMGAGCAILTTDAPIQRSIVGRGGIFANPFDPREIREKLVAIVEDPCALYTWARATRDRFVQVYHRDVVGEQYWRLFSETARS